MSDSVGPYGLQSAGFSVHGTLQARVLERVAMASSGDLPDPGMELTSLTSPALARGFFTTSTTWQALESHQLKSF